MHPRKLRCPLKRGPFEKERIVFQKLFFTGHVSFQEGVPVLIYINESNSSRCAGNIRSKRREIWADLTFFVVQMWLFFVPGFTPLPKVMRKTCPTVRHGRFYLPLLFLLISLKPAPKKHYSKTIHGVRTPFRSLCSSNFCNDQIHHLPALSPTCRSGRPGISRCRFGSTGADPYALFRGWFREDSWPLGFFI